MSRSIAGEEENLAGDSLDITNTESLAEVKGELATEELAQEVGGSHAKKVKEDQCLRQGAPMPRR